MDTELILVFMAGIATIYIGNRNIQIANITRERAKWRNKIRELSIHLYQEAMEGRIDGIDRLQIEFAIRLNPEDEEDKNILRTICELKNKSKVERKQKLEEFSDQVTLLLKHDWERAKYEAKPWYSRLCFFSCLKCLFEPQEERILYKDLKKKYTCIASCNNHKKEIEKQKSSNCCCICKLICFISCIIGLIAFIALIGCGLIKVLRFICQLYKSPPTHLKLTRLPERCCNPANGSRSAEAENTFGRNTQRPRIYRICRPLLLKGAGCC